jgi:hypothetical protein
MFKSWVALLVGIFVILPMVSAVVVAPPVVYWVTLSLSTFFANMLVTLFMYAAAKGLATKTLFGKKLSNLLCFMFSMISRFVVAMVASLASLIIINPITIPEIIMCSLLSVALFLILFFLVSYREIRISSKQKKTVISIIFFGLLVGALTFVSAYYALEKQVIMGEIEKPTIDLKDDFTASSADVSYAAGSPMELEKSMGEEGASDIVEPVKDAAKTIYLQPASAKLCTVTTMGQTYEYEPKLDCVGGSGLSEKRIFCPIKIIVTGDYETGGSCA